MMCRIQDHRHRPETVSKTHSLSPVWGTPELGNSLFLLSILLLRKWHSWDGSPAAEALIQTRWSALWTALCPESWTEGYRPPPAQYIHLDHSSIQPLPGSYRLKLVLSFSSPDTTFVSWSLWTQKQVWNLINPWFGCSKAIGVCPHSGLVFASHFQCFSCCVLPPTQVFSPVPKPS